jgi:hypothetical protein
MAVLAAMNLKQVQNAINQFAEKDIIRMSRSAVGRGATRFKTRVKQTVPKESGELKKSIRTKRANGRDKFDPIRIVYSKIGYYNTLLYGYREGYTYRRKNSYIDITVNGHKVANPKGNWWDIASKRYAKEYKQNITEFLRENIRRDAAKAYSKTATSKFRGR